MTITFVHDRILLLMPNVYCILQATAFSRVTAFRYVII